MTKNFHLRLATLLLIAQFAVRAFAQSAPQLIPPQLEKELSAHASDVTEVTLNKSMLSLATQFMHGKGDDDAATRHLLEGLEGIYVRNYEFDKDGEYSPDQIEKLRQSFMTPEWTPVVHEHERRSGETSDILIKVVNGENRGLFICSAEPREISIVLILGPIRVEDLSKLHGLAGLGALAQFDRDDAPKIKEKDKEKSKAKKDGDQ
ncbi:MAG TPA: DUF4252 domain-containing protein [Terracidiphilus sp.]|jgi:hypothetical protein|nr:DUF4252 domain-containing protein [Terracidiphilus sp.]